MRVVRIKIALPSNIVGGVAKSVLAEIWDASLADAPSVLLTQELLHDVTLIPNSNLEVELRIPHTRVEQVLIVRVHISMDGSKQIKPGDLLTTSFVEVPHNLENNRLTVPVALIN
jgi:hypothetical protein